MDNQGDAEQIAPIKKFKRWKCDLCTFIYDEQLGWPDDGIPAGTRWEDVPEDWICPECGAGKQDFNMIEIID